MLKYFTEKKLRRPEFAATHEYFLKRINIWNVISIHFKKLKCKQNRLLYVTPSIKTILPKFTRKVPIKVSLECLYTWVIEAIITSTII